MQCLIVEADGPLGISGCPNGHHFRSLRPGWLQPLARGVLACLLLFWCCIVPGQDISYSSGVLDPKNNSDKPPRITVVGPGSATLSDIHATVPKAPLSQVAAGVWYLQCELFMENGAKLVLHGTKIGGDVSELRLKSNNHPEALRPGSTEPFGTNIISLTADWGEIDIRSTFITSWDEDVGGPDTEYSSFGRSFIRVRSYLDDDLVTPHESRMDVIDTEISHLGSHNAESYGLTWKVNPPKTPGLFTIPITNLYSLVNVYGDIKNCHIHNNFFGVYTFGAFGMQMINNEVDHNVWYGFDPHDDSDYLTIQHNNVHHNGTHGIIASQRCDHIIIRDNTSWNNTRCGIMLHRYDTYGLIENNRCLNNGDSGIALFATSLDTVRSNVCIGNVASGIRCSVGADDNIIQGNEFAGSPAFGLYLYKGNDPAAPGDDGHPRRNTFVSNWVHDNANSGIFLTSGDANVFTGNRFNNNAGPLLFVNGGGNLLDSNTIPSDVIIQTQGSTTAGSTTIIRNQPIANVQVDIYSSATFTDASSLIFDPVEGGIDNTVTPTGTSMALTSSDIGKTSTVSRRNLTVLPNAGLALVAITIWNTSGDLGKRWTVQAGSSTTRISYKVGDLLPNTPYNVFKNGAPTRYTTDSNGFLSFQDSAVATGSAEFIVMHL